jgi:hypothetical protein
MAMASTHRLAASFLFFNKNSQLSCINNAIGSITLNGKNHFFITLHDDMANGNGITKIGHPFK